MTKIKIILVLLLSLIPVTSISKKPPESYIYFNDENFKLVKISELENIYSISDMQSSNQQEIIYIKEYKNIPKNVNSTQYAYRLAKKIKAKYSNSKFTIKEYKDSKTSLLMILNSFSYKNKPITEYSIIKIRRSLYNDNFLSFKYTIRNYGEITNNYATFLKEKKDYLIELVKSYNIPKLQK